jgi:hypothetical protein
MKASKPEFAELNGAIVQVERIIHLARECGAEDLVAMVKQALATRVLPIIVALLCRTDGEQRAAVAECYRRLEGILSQELHREND